MNMQTLISNATAIINKSSSVTKTDINTLLKFVENLQIFGADNSRLEHLRQAQKVMIPCVRDYFKHNGFSKDFNVNAAVYYSYIEDVVAFVEYVLKHNVNGIILYRDIEDRFYETFHPIYVEDVFFKNAVLCNSIKRIGLKSIQTLIDMLLYSYNCENVKFEPAFSHFTCSLLGYGSCGATFKMEYRNGLCERVKFSIIDGVPSFTYKTL